MTEAAPGSAPAGSPPATTGNDGTPGSAVVATDPLAGLDTGSREWVEKNGIKSLPDAVKAAREAQSLIGKSVQIPDEKAKPEDFDKFYGKLGRPEKPDGYEFKLPDGLPEGMPYDADFAKAFKDQAHKAGLTTKQATAAHDFYVGTMAERFKADHQKVADRLNSATEGLTKAWGPPEGEKFKDGSATALRGLQGLGLEKAFQDAGLMGPNNLVLDPAIALALEKVGRSMFMEASLVTGQSGGVADNPFKDGPDKGNMTVMMQAIKADKAAAIRAMRAAGRDPKEWNLTE